MDVQKNALVLAIKMTTESIYIIKNVPWHKRWVLCKHVTSISCDIYAAGSRVVVKRCTHMRWISNKTAREMKIIIQDFLLLLFVDSQFEGEIVCWNRSFHYALLLFSGYFFKRKSRAFHLMCLFFFFSFLKVLVFEIIFLHVFTNG